jgi:mannosylglycerate hydrolase
VNITTVYRLVRGERFLRMQTTVENTVKDHILRVLFPTDLKTDTVCAETPFDVVSRRIPVPDTRDWREPYKPVQPHRSFVDLSDGKRGVALLNRGLTQYEAVDNPQRTLALTLFRAHRAWNSVRLAYYPDESGTQLQGTHTFEYALMPHKGNWDEAGVAYVAEWFNVPFSVGAAGAGDGTLPPVFSCLEVQGHGLVLDAMKQGEWNEKVLILRVSNPTDHGIDGKIVLHIPVNKAEVVNGLETEVETDLPIRNGCVALKIPAKKIMTLRLTPAEKGKK